MSTRAVLWATIWVGIGCTMVFYLTYGIYCIFSVAATRTMARAH